MNSDTITIGWVIRSLLDRGIENHVRLWDGPRGQKHIIERLKWVERHIAIEHPYPSSVYAQEDAEMLRAEGFSVAVVRLFRKAPKAPAVEPSPAMASRYSASLGERRHPKCCLAAGHREPHDLPATIRITEPIAGDVGMAARPVSSTTTAQLLDRITRLRRAISDVVVNLPRTDRVRRTLEAALRGDDLG